MFSIWTILRIIFSIIFTVVHIYFTQFINAIEEKKNCPLSTGWRITNGKLISSLLMIIGLINIFLPASKFLSTIPLIGSSYVLLFVIALFSELFIIYRLVDNIGDDENSNCKVKGYNFIINFFSDKDLSQCVFYTIIVSVLFFYL